MSRYRYDSVPKLRAGFWEFHPQYRKAYKLGKRQNEYNAEIRTAWTMFLDYCEKDKLISNQLADKATL